MWPPRWPPQTAATTYKRPVEGPGVIPLHTPYSGLRAEPFYILPTLTLLKVEHGDNVAEQTAAVQPATHCMYV